jgi:ParB/RepB/Spo0J family partition protein
MSLKEFDANSGAAIASEPDEAPAAPARIVTFDNVPLGLIVPSLTNTRGLDKARLEQLASDGADGKAIAAALSTLTDQTLAEITPLIGNAKMAELVMGIAAMGVNTPILLRPLPGTRVADTTAINGRRGAPRPTYEIVAGERRFWASLIARKTTIPAMIKSMADGEAQEFQLVENLQRDDLTELEEAEGYRQLCEATGIRKEDIAAKIGKSRTHVYQILQLLKLGQEARDAFRAGKFEFSKALLLAGVADPKLQLKALKEVTNVGYGGRTITVRDFRDWLQQNVMLKLDHAPFDIQDVTLNDGAGSCADCPKRTGVNRDIFEAFDSPDMCTDAKCYGVKASVSLQRIKDAAAEKGMTVIAGVEAKKLKPHSWGEEIKGYTRLDEKLDTGGTVGKALGKDAPAPVLFVDPHTHKQVKVLPSEVVGQLLKDKGIETGKATRQADTKKYEAERRKAEAERKVEAAWRARAAGQIVNQVRAGAITAFSASVLRLLISAMLKTMCESYEFAERAECLLPLWGLPAAGENDDPTEAIERHVQAAADTELGPMLIALLASDEVEYRPHYQDGKKTPVLDLLAGETGVDLAEIQREVKAEHKAAAKAAAAQTAGAKDKAAPQGSVAQGGKAAAKGKAAGGRGKKLSAEEAKSGIANAMQDVEPASGGGDEAALSTEIDVNAAWPFPPKARARK